MTELKEKLSEIFEELIGLFPFMLIFFAIFIMIFFIVWVAITSYVFAKYGNTPLADVPLWVLKWLSMGK